ncbi:MAG: AzlD domain-containing protein [Lachnospiraceae bacterium]|nr:AzlD domain-containing protein [Lachnospiraceae bacterium]
MKGDLYLYLFIAVMALTTYGCRVFPFVVMRRPIKSRFARSFLYYVPYVTLAVMTFPAIMEATEDPWAGLAAMITGVVCAWISGDLFLVAGTCCITVFLLELIL